MREALPYLCYLAGSLCFVTGSAITLWRLWR
jgi:hypothetical protein